MLRIVDRFTFVSARVCLGCMWVLCLVAVCFPIARLLAASAADPNVPASVSLPVPLTNVAAISAGARHTCALTTAGGVKCWGQNFKGQLGDNSTLGRATPGDVSGLTSGIKAISAGGSHSCALTLAGGIKCWGYNSFGQLGDGSNTDSAIPVDVTGLASSIATIVTGDLHTCALTTAGGVKCWGINASGQLGNGSTDPSLIPVDVSGLTSDVTAISVSSGHTCALTTSGGVKCWGYNGEGGLGDGTTNPSLIPVDVTGLTSGVIAIGTGGYHSCAITTIGGLQCWGNNFYGQLGDTFTANRPTPANVSGLTRGVAAIGGGGWHTCVLTIAGGLKCWGYNNQGELGDGSTTQRTIPVDVSGLSSGMAAVDGGEYHTCAMTYGGGVKCWGNNSSGQLGDTTFFNRALAGDVLVPATCYALSRTHSGSGGDPTTTPNSTPGCPPGHYLPGQIVVVSASPAAQRFVQSWTGTSNNSLRDILNYLTMPAADATVNVTYGICRTLTRAHSGDGSDPATTPTQSTGCPVNSYVAGERITLIADPAVNSYVASWTGADNAGGVIANALTMPAANATVSVTYGVCHTLTRAHSGDGGDPLAVPNSSSGCGVGKYAAGVAITLIAAPAAEQRVKSWTNADQSPATGNLVNVVTMPNAVRTVTVVYEPCFQLTAGTLGQGEPIAASPVASFGCALGTYIAGQTIVLSAAPASGWKIAGWSGTTNDASSANTNSLTMPSVFKSVGIVYAEIPDTEVPTSLRLHLPSLSK